MFELLTWCPKLGKADPVVTALFERALWAPACEHARAIAKAALDELNRQPAPEKRVSIVTLLREVWASPLTSPTEAVLAYVALSRWLRGPGTVTWNDAYDDAYRTLKQFQQLQPLAEAINRVPRPGVAALVALMHEQLTKAVPGEEALLAVYQEIAETKASKAAPTMEGSDSSGEGDSP